MLEDRQQLQLPISPYKRAIMLKTDGVKVYVFLYTFSYVITLTDLNLTVMSYSCTASYKPIANMTNTPDVVTAEIIMSKYLGRLELSF